MEKPPRILPGDPPHGLFLGWRQDKEPIAVCDDRDEGHLVTIAPTGAGKGVSAVIPALLTWRGPAIVIDPRGENYAVTARRRADLGQQVHVLDPFRITSAPRSDRFNPLQLINTRRLDYEDDIAAIANMLVNPAVHASSQDPYWTERATALISMAITELFHAPVPPPTVSLSDAADLIRYGDAVIRIPAPTADQQAPKSSETLPSDPLPIIRSFTPPVSEFANDRTRAAIYSTAASHLGFLRSPAVQLALADGINPSDITAGKPMTIFIVVPHDKLNTHAGLLRLWIGSMLMCIGRRRTRPELPTLFLVDEAAQLGQLEQLRTALTLFRGYALRVWTFWQDMSQLQRTYRDWESILNNCSTQQFFSPATPFARNQLDTYLQGAAPHDAFRGDKAVLLAQGNTQIITRANYRRDRLFAGLSSPNPFYSAPQANVIPFPADR